MSVNNFINDYLKGDPQPTIVTRYLLFLRKIGYKPRVVYDIGAYNTSFANLVNEIFPDTRVILIDNADDADEKFVGYEYYKTCLSNENKEVEFYELASNKKVKSYYKPKTFNEEYDKVSKVSAESLDNLVKRCGLPYPDFIRIDCCGAEQDILLGGQQTLLLTKYLMVNLQNEELFNEAPLASIAGPFIKSLGYDVKDILDLYNTPLIDYVFENKNI